MGNRQKCAKFQENLFKSNEVISIFCPPLFRKRPMTIASSSKLSNDEKIGVVVVLKSNRCSIS